MTNNTSARQGGPTDGLLRGERYNGGSEELDAQAEAHIVMQVWPFQGPPLTESTDYVNIHTTHSLNPGGMRPDFQGTGSLLKSIVLEDELEVHSLFLHSWKVTKVVDRTLSLSESRSPLQALRSPSDTLCLL